MAPTCHFWVLNIDKDTISFPEVVGTWYINKANGNNPKELSIDFNAIRFLSNGTFVYEAHINWNEPGKVIKGSGIWSLAKDELVYTINNKSGRSKIKLENGILKLNPDPILAFEGKNSIASEYSK